MAIVSVKESQSHAQFIASREGHNWTCPYIIETDGARTGPLEIVEYFGNTLHRGIDSSMVYGDEHDPFAFCDSIAPVRRQRSHHTWDVTLQYSTPRARDAESEQRDWTDSEGNPTQDPFAWAGEMSIATQYIEVPVWSAWNVDAFPIESTLYPSDTATYYRDANTLGPVVNSAGTVLDPPLMAQVSEQVIHFTLNVPMWSGTWIESHENKINDVPLQYADRVVADYIVEPRTFAAYTLRCTSIRGSYAIAMDGDTRVPYWKVSVEMRYRSRASDTNPIDGWLESVLDRGLSRGATFGDPDGYGGIYTLKGDHEDGMGHTSPIHGPSGSRIGEMVLLNGYGQPLVPSDPRAKTGVYCRWRKHGASDFFFNMPFSIFGWS
jgi:hypothetical protein